MGPAETKFPPCCASDGIGKREQKTIRLWSGGMIDMDGQTWSVAEGSANTCMGHVFAQAADVSRIRASAMLLRSA